jgi:hypothetical protein
MRQQRPHTTLDIPAQTYIEQTHLSLQQVAGVVLAHIVLVCQVKLFGKAVQ